MSDLVIGPTGRGDEGAIRLYCPRCDVDLGSWPSLAARDVEAIGREHDRASHADGGPCDA